MVLSTLADVIYNLFLFVYYVLKSCIFIGSLLFDIVCYASSTTYKCLHVVHDFVSVVLEDNQEFIRDVKTFFGGTVVFFCNNIATVSCGIYNIVTNICKAVAGLLVLPAIIVESVKKILVLLGEAVWFIFTLPKQLLIIFVEGVQSLVEHVANAVVVEIRDTTKALIHYTTHDLSFEACCGLGLLVLAYYCPTPRKIAFQCILSAAVYLYIKLCSVIMKCIRLGSRIEDKIRSIASRFNSFQLLNALGIAQLCVSLHAYAANVYDRGSRLLLACFQSLLLIRTNERPRDATDTVPAQHQHTPNRSSIGLCIICEDHDRSIAFVPCGHICVCKVCSIHLCYHNPVCPLCRSYIQQKLEVYI